MNLISDMKLLHAKKFKEGSIKQATFLKSYKKEIFELVSLGYKPSEIKGYLEEKLDVSIKMNAFYAWLNYTKVELLNKQSNSIEENTNIQENIFSSTVNTNRPESTLDILSSTDFD